MEPGFFIKNIWALRKGLLAGMEIKAKYLEEYNERQA